MEGAAEPHPLIRTERGPPVARRTDGDKDGDKTLLRMPYLFLFGISKVLDEIKNVGEVEVEVEVVVGG